MPLCLKHFLIQQEDQNPEIPGKVYCSIAVGNTGHSSYDRIGKSLNFAT